MAVRPRVAAGYVDLGDQQGLIEEVTLENEELYDLTYQTMIEAFTEPLTTTEIDDILDRLDMQALAALVAVDPDAATKLLKAARERANA